MCGIAGLFAPTGRCPSDIQVVARDMVRQLTHRGPDDEGVWCDFSSGLSLAHRRLSVLDLSDAGRQPMLSHSGRYVVIFNGEIYNHVAIRQELEAEGVAPDAQGWRGHSDTETLLAAVACWGLQKTLDNAVGMFAFALWDRQEKVLYLARDRIGEKPLYYGLFKGVLLFASELKAIRTYPGFEGEIDRGSLAQFLCRNMILAPRSIYRGIFKLPPGAFLRMEQDDIAKESLDVPRRYWALSEAVVAGQGNTFQGDKAEAIGELERLLKQSISGQMLADVPVGAFLSGGIDSSTVVALMQAQSIRPVKTFTIGFHESEYNEAEYASRVAAYLGTEHTELYVAPDEALEVIPRLPELYDEPFADVSQIPTYLVSALAQKHVTVCLSGDGGDELFGGYNRYVSGGRLWRYFGWMPHGVRAKIAAVLNATSPLVWDSCFDMLSMILPHGWRVKARGDKLHKIAEMLSATTSEEVYARLTTSWTNSESIVLESMQPTNPPLDPLGTSFLHELEHQMMYRDTITYLPDDILVKVDRAAMGVSLETRVPMLDHRVVEFAWTLPIEMKIRGGQGKWILQRNLDRYVPRSLIERPKAGFGVPVDSWLRGSLRDWAAELLDPVKLKNQGFFDPEPIYVKWKEHLTGRRNWSSQLWSVLMFQAWLSEHHRNG